MLTKAGQPEILRSSQRDEVFEKYFTENVSEIIQSVCGIRFWIKYKRLTKILSNILYNVMTTMSNLQTLGEEYTGMVQVNSAGNSLPKKYHQFTMIILNNFGEKILCEALKKIEISIENLPKDHPLQQSVRLKLIKMLKVLRICFPLLSKFHKALFYLNGDYYDVGKRLCGIRYGLVRYWLKDRSSLQVFKILGIISVIHTILLLIFTIINFKNLKIEKEIIPKTLSDSNEESNKCSLCLNGRQNTSVTPCGHLYCWSCIIPWLLEQPKCPLCRQGLQPSRVVFLQNYSSAC